jgi:dihydroneopterin aldolase
MIGTIGFKKHRIHCVIGNNPEERNQAQDIFVDLRVKVDFANAAQSDNLKDTICYTFFADLCTQLAQKNRYRLLETFAAAVLENILQQPNVQSAWIRIRKPNAIPTAEYALIELEKSL